jgi:GAF domain
MSETRKPAADAAASGERHGRDLQKVNEKLRELVASLRTERERLSTDGRAHVPASPPSPPPAVADASHDPVDLEKKRLAAELALAHEAVAHATEERERLRARLAELEAENQRMCDDYVAVQDRSTGLAHLYVALERIHGGLSRADTLAAMQEIVINVIGSEELAIFERRGDGLALVQSFGIDPEPWRELRPPRGAIARAAAGKLYVAGREGPPDAGDEDLTACIPLRVGDRVAGVIAIFRLLGHKPVLGDADQAVFDLLITHAGLALHLREARERALPA